MIPIKLTPEILARLDKIEDPELRKKHETAIRNARVLVSDLKIYNEDLVKAAFEKPLDKRRIMRFIGPLIKQSWQMYKQKIDPEILKESNYLKEALNEMLAGGEKVF